MFERLDGSRARFERPVEPTMTIPSGTYFISGNYRGAYADPETKAPCMYVQAWTAVLPGDAQDLDVEIPSMIVDPFVPMLFDGLAAPGVRFTAVHFSNAIACGAVISGESTIVGVDRTKIGYYGEYGGPNPSADWAGVALRIETSAGPRYVRIGAPPPESVLGVAPFAFRFDLTPDHLATIAALPPNVLGC